MDSPVSDGTGLSEETKRYIIAMSQNDQLCRWFENASAVDRLAYLAEHDPPTPWHRSSGT